MNLFLIKHTIKYLLTSGHKYGHRIHSPFVFDFVQSVFRAKYSKSVFSPIENRRRALMLDTRKIVITDFGAGSKRKSSNTRTISYIARTSASSGKYARLLFAITKRYQPRTILELGTSLGIGTAYLAYGCPEAKLISLEGSQSIADEAVHTMEACGINSAQIMVGNFDDTLGEALRKLQYVDCAYIDGNHTKEATLRYFEQIYPYCNADTVLIFDDISWSEGMYEAWQTIIADERVRISIDICKKGLVFFRKGIEKQCFTIRY